MSGKRYTFMDSDRLVPVLWEDWHPNSRRSDESTDDGHRIQFESGKHQPTPHEATPQVIEDEYHNGSQASASSITAHKSRRCWLCNDASRYSEETVEESIVSAREAEINAVIDMVRSVPANDLDSLKRMLDAILKGSSPDDADAIRESLNAEATGTTPGIDTDSVLSPTWQSGGYPYQYLLSRKAYEKQKYRLQVELLKLQSWVKKTGQRVVILFEGRDAAGKGGAIKRFMEHMNPRGARVVALEKPTDMERGQWYFQRYVQHLPTRGEIVMFDRSWYNRAGVERVMGFCTPEEYNEFMRQAPEFERNLSRSGIHLIKFWFSVSRKEQLRRFTERERHP